MSFTKELNILNIGGLVIMSLICILLSAFFLNRSADKEIENLKTLLTEERMNQLKDQVATAFSVVETASFYEEAQKSISEMKFGERKQNSFYVIDGDGMFFVNSTNPDYVGKVRAGHKDYDGREYVREIIKTAREKGEGFIRYREVQNGSIEPLSKMAYFRYFKNWNWIIYAGININDIDDKIMTAEKRIEKDFRGQMLFLTVSAIIILSCLIFMNSKLVAARIIQPIKALTTAAEDMSLGNFDTKIDIRSNSEIRSLSESIERLRASLSIAMKRLKDRPSQEMDMAG